jgi:hypothetical protein
MKSEGRNPWEVGTVQANGRSGDFVGAEVSTYDGVNAPVKAIRSLLLLVVLAATAVAPLGNSQDMARPRLGRPLDWSHAHLVASRGGPDGGLSIYSDWRTVFRHLEID